ncbi:MAG: DNA damage-inducible protein D [Hyphomicrobiales bacterium]|nr:DNA damage-inducible protein D [Hyphomicrobiales bacterium]
MSKKELSELPEYGHTMERLEAARRVSKSGVEYWTAREMSPILGYPVWSKFEPVLERARAAMESNGIDSSHHIAQTGKMVELGSGSERRVIDYFITRAACYLIAMNGDPSKAEIAAAQAYFAVQTRRMEIEDTLAADEKRLELREKVSRSHRRVSKIAQEAGVRSKMQGVFHDARYTGLYNMSLRSVKAKKGLRDDEQLYDRAGPLELSANDFQMNLAADVITRDHIKGEQRAIATNRTVGLRVRRAMTDSGATMPEDLALEPPIKEIVKRVKAQKTLPPSGGSSNA